MKSKELIRRLQEEDPTGETEVVVGNADIYTVEGLPAYYDGALNVLVRDPGKRPFYDVIGMREVREGAKIRLNTLSLWEVVENGHPFFDKLQIIGRDDFVKRARQINAEIERICNDIECDAFEKFCQEKLDFQDHDAITKFFYGNQHLARHFSMTGRSISNQRKLYWTDCVKLINGILTYVTGFETKNYSLPPGATTEP